MNEEPTEKASDWFVGVVVSAVFAALFFGGSAAWVFSHYDPTNLNQMAIASRTLAPFLVGAGAIVTFFTVAWRGVINKQQADETRRTNDHSEEARLVDLLDRGIELLRQKDIEKKIIGIKMLETVALSPRGSFAKDALQFIALQMAEATMIAWENDVNNRYFRACWLSLEKAKVLGRTGEPWTYNMSDGERSGSLASFQLIAPGKYYGGVITFDSIQDWETLLDREEIEFMNCTIFAAYSPGIEIPKSASSKFIDVVFKRSKIKKFEFATKFEQCDFTGCEFPSVEITERCEFENCFYYDRDLPIISGTKNMPELIGLDGILRRESGLTKISKKK